jgi:nucleoid-associated protein YgaU
MGKENIREEISEKSQGRTSRLGKEAKIGITVIVLLLITFGVVAFLRLRGMSLFGKSESGDAVASADQDHNKGKSQDKDGIDALFKESKSNSLGTSSSSAVVAVKPVSPKPAASDADLWKIPSDDTKRTSEASKPPKPLRSDPQDRYALDPPMDRGEKPHSLHESHARGTDDDDPPLPTPGSALPHSKKMASDEEGFATADAPPPPLPPHREEYRSEREKMMQSQSPAYAQHSALPAAASRYGDSRYGDSRSDDTDYRREPIQTVRAGSPPPLRRSAAPSYSEPPAQRDDGKYEVQPNDSYWTISERLYGTGAYFKALAQHNLGKGITEERLRPGELISAPQVAELEKSYPDLCPKASRREAQASQSQNRITTVSGRGSFRGGRTYTVAEGDTLFNIARYELGKASRWVEIYELNRDTLGKDFNYLTPGIQLNMPEGEKSSDVMAQPPGSTYRR